MNKPFIVKPIFKDYIWGGQRLIKDLHKETSANPCAEAWEFSTHKDGISLCGSGKYKGKSLKEILLEHPEYLGKYKNDKGEAPILIKFIDAKEDLSIQVHPSDEYALKYENSLGKTEVWYLLDSVNGKLAVGFNKDTNKEEVLNAINDNKITDLINYFDVKKDEFYPIESGTVHAICAGCLLVEIQENSNLTYRMFDYNRKDKNGNLRELHIDKCLDVLNYSKYNKPKQSELNYNCKYFNITKVKNEFSLETNDDNFIVLICIKGKGKVCFDNECLDIKYGDTLFIPSDSKCNFTGISKYLKVEV